MDIKDIKILINEVSNSNLYEFRYEENGIKTTEIQQKSNKKQHK